MVTLRRTQERRQTLWIAKKAGHDALPLNASGTVFIAEEQSEQATATLCHERNQEAIWAVDDAIPVWIAFRAPQVGSFMQPYLTLGESDMSDDWTGVLEYQS